MKHENIILIGMPGCGKSTIGIVLAKTLMKGFCDTDLLIQETEDNQLYKIIEEQGIDIFTKIENRVVSSIKAKNLVIATGGSVVFGADAMKNLKELGKVIYLKLPLSEIERRIKNITTRGIVMSPGSTLKQIYDQRTPLYEKYADITINCSGKTLEEIVSLIADALGTQQDLFKSNGNLY